MPLEHAVSWTDQPTLNDPAGNAAPTVVIDVDRLVETRALVQANSGAGKSYTLRRLLEQTYGKVQHLVIDVEGEFHTLREKYDYVLAAPKGGDCVADIRSAALLARRLLELGASCIIDIYELGAQQTRFVKLFLESLMSAPRDLWHSVLVVVDEAHKFCAEKEDAESSSAVIDLMTRGRKRGYCGVLATQRLSTLAKSAAAEANNLIIGRTALDLDIARAALVLGMPIKDARAILPKLAPGEFFVVGPALTPTVERVRIGHVETNHPRAGTRGAPPTPPRAKVRAILAKLADLPAEAEEEAKTMVELKKRIRELETGARIEDAARVARHRRSDGGAGRTGLEEKLSAEMTKLSRENISLRKDAEQHQLSLNAYRHMAAGVIKMHAKQNEAYDRLMREVGDIENERHAESDAAVAQATAALEHHRKTGVLPITKAAYDFLSSLPATDESGSMPRMERAFLTALAQHPAGLSKDKLLLHADYANGGATVKCFAKLAREGWVDASMVGTLRITDAGLTALGTWTPLPVGDELRAHILNGSRLSGMEKKLLEVICQFYPREVTKKNVLEHTGYANGGATVKAFARIVALDYARASSKGSLIAAEELFG